MNIYSLWKARGMPSWHGKWVTTCLQPQEVRVPGKIPSLNNSKDRTLQSSTIQTKQEKIGRSALWTVYRMSQNRLKFLGYLPTMDRRISLTLWSEGGGRRLILIKLSAGQKW